MNQKGKHLICRLTPVSRDQWCLTEREGEMSKKNKRLFKISLVQDCSSRGLLNYLCDEIVLCKVLLGNLV